MYRVKIEENFSAAHQLRDYKGRCADLHGHNWKVVVTVKAEKLDEKGIAIDFYELQTLVKNILKEIDHKNLNELEHFSYQNPSSENIARLIYTKIQEVLPVYLNIEKVEVVECEGCSVIYSE